MLPQNKAGLVEQLKAEGGKVCFVGDGINDEPAENISSMVDGWQSGRFIAYRSLPGWPQGAWSFLLTPGRYTDLVREPRQTIQRIAQFAALPWDDPVEQRVAQALPPSRMTISAPAADKWRKHAGQLAPLLPALELIIRQVEAIG